MNEILNILGSVGFNWHVALANFVNFLIILFLLNRFFFTKIGKTIDARQKTIEHGLNQAREGEQKLAHAEEEKEAILKSAHKQKDEIIANGESIARELALSIEQSVQESISKRQAKLDQEEATLEARVEKEFALKAPALVAKLYTATLMKEMSAQENDALISRMQ